MVIINETPSGSWPIKLKVSLFVEVPEKTLWRVLTDYKSLDEFVPHLKKCTIVDKKGDKVSLEQTYKYFPLTMHLGLEIKEEPPNRIVFESYSGNMKTYKGYWELEPVHSKSTVFTMEVEAEPNFPVPHTIKVWVLESELPKGLLAMRERALKISGQPMPTYPIKVLTR